MQAQTRITQLFYAYLLIHLVCWTLAPTLIRHNLPLDAVEGAIWGHQLEWGYDKNPFMNGWLTALAVHFSQPSMWMVYLFSQLSIVVCLWTVWAIAKRMLPPTLALLSVLLLEGVQYFNFHSIDFNDNTLELGLWGLTTYFFYRALTTQKKTTWFWVLTGLFAGLSMMTKYYALALFAGMGLFLLSNKQNRQQLFTFAPWLSLCVCFIVMLPHLLWLPMHNYITIQYVFERGAGMATHKNHIFFPVQFAWQQLEVFAGGIALFLLFLIGKRPIFANKRLTLSTFNWQFLMFVGLGPFILTCLLSSIFNIKLRAGWGVPLQSLWGIMLVALIQPAFSAAKLKRAIALTVCLVLAMITAYAISLFYSKDRSTANFPGPELAKQITQTWHKRYHTPLKYLVGSRWASGNVALYSKDQPAVLIEGSHDRSPWVDMNDLRTNGAIFIWDITKKKTLPRDIRQRFPRLGKNEVIRYHWQHDYYHLPQGEIGVAFLPPLAATHTRL